MTGEPTVPVPIPDLLAAKGGHVPPIDPIRLRAIEHLIGVLQERARTATTRTIEVEAFSVLTVVDGTEDLIRGVRDLAADNERLRVTLDLAARVETLEQENARMRGLLRHCAEKHLGLTVSREPLTEVEEEKLRQKVAEHLAAHPRATGQSTTP